MNAVLLQQAQVLLSEQNNLRNALHALDSKIQAWVAQVELAIPSTQKSSATPPPLSTPLPIPGKPPTPLTSPSQLPPPLPVPASSTPDRFELRLGSLWMVRIGILLLLTGLAFLGNYTVETLALHAGPLTRLLILVAASLGLLGAGHYFESRPPKLRQFGQVLSGGGAAGLYFCAYGAHAISGLRVLSSEPAGHLLLVAASTGILLLAHWKNAEPLAVLTVALSGYTVGLYPGGWPPVLLATVSVLLLLKKGWPGVVLAGLPATFASLVWNQNRQLWTPDLSGAFWEDTWPVLACWLIFTAGCFLARGPQGNWRILTFTANNTLLLALACPAAAAAFPKGGAWCALASGLVLLGLYSLTRMRRDFLLPLEGASLAQGLLTLTAALAMVFGGYHRSLMFALETAALAELSIYSRHHRILKAGSLLCMAVAVGTSLGGHSFTPNGLLVLTQALLFLGTAWRTKQALGLLVPGRWTPPAAAFTAGALLLVLRFLLSGGMVLDPTIALAILTLALACSLPLLRLPEVASLGLGYLLVAFLLLFESLWSSSPAGLLPVVSVAAATLLFPWVFRHQKTWVFASEKADSFSLPPVFLLTFFLHAWIPRTFPHAQTGPALLIAECTFLAAGTLAANLWATRLGVSFGVLGFLHLASDCVTLQDRLGPVSEALPLTLGVAFQAVIAGFFASSATGRAHPRAWTLFFRGQLLAATISGLLWCRFFLQPGLPVLGLTTLGTAVLAFGAWKKHGGWMAWAGALFFAVWSPLTWQRIELGFAHALLPCGSVEHALSESLSAHLTYGNWIAILLLFCCQQFVRRTSISSSVFPEWTHRALILTGLGTLWWSAHHLVADCSLRAWITVLWSATAAGILAAGFFLRERLFRQCGLLLFGLAVIRLCLVDVWKFDTLYRILSFLVLGCLLIVFSFYYNRLASRETSDGNSQEDQAS